MTRNSKIELSVDEIMSLLKRTSLPTIVVEGVDDMIVYRALEQRLVDIGASMFPVGGRKKVLDVFNRKGEIPKSVNIAFIADKDSWVNIGIPVGYVSDDLIFTEGYSIENDVFVDGELWKLLKGNECQKFEKDLSDFVEWYALALNRHLNNPADEIALHPDHVLNPAERNDLLTLRQQEQYPVALRDELLVKYTRLVRGKSLLNLLIRNTNYKGREPRHTDKALLESVSIRPGPLLDRIAKKVSDIIVT